MPEETNSSKGSNVDEGKALAAISYIWILFIIPLLMKSKSDFAKYHAKQGLVFFIFSTICGFLLFIPVIGALLGLASFILFLIGLINALSGKKQPLPVIGQYAEKFNI